MTPKEFRTLRRRMGMTQVALARVLGVHPISVARWEGGQHKVSSPVAKLMARLAANHTGKGK